MRRSASGRRSVVRKSVICLAAVAAAPTFLPSSVTRGANLTWDSNGNVDSAPVDGAGAWDITTQNWWNGSADVSWDNAPFNTAVFGAGGTGGAVTVNAAVSVNGITLAAPG